MKLKKYSLGQLKQFYPSLSQDEASGCLGGFQDIGGGYVQLSYSEMRDVFGDLETLPGIALNGYCFCASEDPFYSYVDRVGFYVNPDAPENANLPSSFVSDLNELLNHVYIDIEIGSTFSPEDQTYIVPISSLGAKAEEWGLSTSQDDNGVSGFSQGNDDNWHDIANRVASDAICILHLSDVAPAITSLKNNLFQTLRDNDLIPSQIHWEIEPYQYGYLVQVFYDNQTLCETQLVYEDFLTNN